MDDANEMRFGAHAGDPMVAGDGGAPGSLASRSVVSPATHTWFWFFGALCIVGAFLAAAGVLRRTMSVIDRASRLIAAAGIVLAVGGLGGSLAVAAAAPGSMVSVMSAMVGHGTTVAPVPAPSPKPGVSKLTVIGVDFKFEPNTLTVPAGKPVDVVFQNQSASSPHTFTITSLGFEVKADPGATDSGTLKGLKPGTYQFICSIPGHAQLGMTGTLIVK